MKTVHKTLPGGNEGGEFRGLWDGGLGWWLGGVVYGVVYGG